MPMIDVYATVGTFKDPKSLARDLAETLMKIEQVPNIPMFRKNTAAFVHDLPDGALSNVDGDGNYVRVQVLTNAGALTSYTNDIALAYPSVLSSPSIKFSKHLEARMFCPDN